MLITRIGYLFKNQKDIKELKNMNLLDNVKSGFGSISEFITDALQLMIDGPKSLSKESKPSILTHRVIVEESLVNNDIMLSLMSFLNQQVVAYVLNAIQLNQFIDSSRTVRDLVSTVATEAYVDSSELVNFKGVPSKKISEAITLENYKTQMIKTGVSIGADDDGRTPYKTIREKELDSKTGSPMIGTKNVKYTGPKVIDMELKSTRLISTRVVEVNIVVDRDTIVPIRLGIHLVPYFINSDVMGAFLDLKNKSGVVLRWKKVLAGELRFFRDFVLCFDILKKYSDTLKKDRQNKLGTILRSRSFVNIRNLANQIAKLNPASSNLASSILIIDKRTMDQNLSNSGTSLSDYIQRQAFFRSALCLMIVVVDDLFNNVTVYYNGLEMYTTCTFAMLNRVGQKSDSYDLKDILSAFGSNQNLKY